jgi:actin related protein 2/3 complex, subunit 1A/1B
MAPPEVHHLFHNPIADHSFAADRQTLAVARDNNVELYQKTGSSFVLKDELKGHDKTVTGVDIAPTSGMIVTCSQGEIFCSFLFYNSWHIFPYNSFFTF